MARIWLDFLRLDTVRVLWGMGVNQLLMIVVFFGVVGWWFGHRLAKFLVAFWILIIMLSGVVSSKPNNTITNHSLQELRVGESKLNVEIVKSPASISQGLSGRPEIGADGMLFLMPNRAKTQFWMPDMQFDLDIIWIDQGEIIGIEVNVPHPLPNTSEQDLILYPSPDMVEWVLEVEAGTAKENNWQVGSQVNLASSPQEMI